MARLTDVPDGASAEQDAIFAGDRAVFGSVLNPTRVYAHVPGVAAAIGALHGALAAAGGIPEELAFLVRVRVAQLHGSPF